MNLRIKNKVLKEIWLWLGGGVISGEKEKSSGVIKMSSMPKVGDRISVDYNKDLSEVILKVVKKKFPGPKTRLKRFIFPWTKRLGVPWWNPWAKGYRWAQMPAVVSTGLTLDQQDQMIQNNEDLLFANPIVDAALNHQADEYFRSRAESKDIVIPFACEIDSFQPIDWPPSGR